MDTYEVIKDKIDTFEFELRALSTRLNTIAEMQSELAATMKQFQESEAEVSERMEAIDDFLFRDRSESSMQNMLQHYQQIKLRKHEWAVWARGILGVLIGAAIVGIITQLWKKFIVH